MKVTLRLFVKLFGIKVLDQELKKYICFSEIKPSILNYRVFTKLNVSKDTNESSNEGS